MALRLRFCSQCAAPVDARRIEGRTRDVCSSCETVFYQNPLPVAACLVLNARHEVLLVKRRNAPHEGMWCLPIGFAETGETIGQAARRELKEETGIDGRIVRLLDADSSQSNFYGDLLIVTFELQKVGGVEEAGDDAEATSYFALDDLPPLAFVSNEKAIRFCAIAHEDEWAIQESFRRLNIGPHDEMASDALVRIIDERVGTIARLWLADVRSNPTTSSLERLDPGRLLELGSFILSQFSTWLKGGDGEDGLRRVSMTVGRELSDAGCALPDLISALMLLRKHVWTYVQSTGVWERPIEVYRVLELNRRIALFFDKVLFHTACGVAEAR